MNKDHKRVKPKVICDFNRGGLKPASFGFRSTKILRNVSMY